MDPHRSSCPHRPRIPELTAIVLAAGAGERLRPFTDAVPKALLPVLDRPMLSLIVGQLAAGGIRRIGVNASHLSEQVVAHAARLEAQLAGVEIDVRVERRLSGPAGGLRLFADLVRASALTIVVSGDALVALDVDELVGRHLEAAADFGVLTKPMTRASRFGVLRADPRGLVEAWDEKPPLPDTEVHNVSCGVYTATTAALEVLPPAGVVDFGLDVVVPLLRLGRPVVALPLARYWSDIGTPAALRDANLDAALGRTGLHELDQIAAEAVADEVYVGEGSQVHAGADVVGPAVIGARSSVAEGARVEGSVLLPGARVDRGERVVGELLAPAGEA